ncbi:hypothetical protein C2S51_007620 [Perilla frutescens var. frutescens]|nr:hypothetical protein C2S51_007620 [Perilla frutescens var. frutescens]
MVSVERSRFALPQRFLKAKAVRENARQRECEKGLEQTRAAVACIAACGEGDWQRSQQAVEDQGGEFICRIPQIGWVIYGVPRPVQRRRSDGEGDKREHLVGDRRFAKPHQLDWKQRVQILNNISNVAPLQADSLVTLPMKYSCSGNGHRYQQHNASCVRETHPASARMSTLVATGLLCYSSFVDS